MPVFCLKILSFLLIVALAAAPAALAEPAGHTAFMADAAYKQAFESWMATLQEAEKCLDARDFAAARKAAEADMAWSVRQDMQGGGNEAEAWGTAWYVGQGTLSRELKQDWLRRNAQGVQGFWRMQSATLDGWLALEQGEEPDLYAVSMRVAPKATPQESVEFEGLGRLKGAVMLVEGRSDVPLAITFKGETASITAGPREQADAGPGFGGTYQRETK